MGNENSEQETLRIELRIADFGIADFGTFVIVSNPKSKIRNPKLRLDCGLVIADFGTFVIVSNPKSKIRNPKLKPNQLIFLLSTTLTAFPSLLCIVFGSTSFTSTERPRALSRLDWIFCRRF